MRVFISTVICILISTLSADDGMWMPHQMKKLNLTDNGLEMNPEDLYKMDGTGLMSAIVYLGGGTGEFVSAEGLILTNHHVAFGALQRAATPEVDYIENGFLANSKQEEIPAPGYVADVLLRYEDITDRMISVLSTGMSSGEKYKALERRKKEIIADAEKEGMDLHCRIADMYSGNQYYLFTFKRLPDVRIVYAPPRDLGNFGGDIDNWMWPRHTADFTFLRAYVSPKNLGAEYNPENVPYRPNSYLKISKSGVNEGDFTFVMGYPGRTYRNYTVSELKSDINRMEKRIKHFKEIIDFYEKAGSENKAVEIKYARKLRGLNNALKNYRGKLEGFQKYNILKRKEKTEYEIIDALKKVNKIAAVRSLEEMTKFIQSYEIFNEEYQIINAMVSRYYGPALLSQTHLVVRAVQEKQKPDLDREDMFQDRNESRLRSRIKLADRGYDLVTDKAYFKHLLQKMLDEPDETLPEFLKDMKSGEVVNYVDETYAKSDMREAETRLKYLDLSMNELKNIKDPLLELAIKIEEHLSRYRDENDARRQEIEDIKKPYLRALLDLKKGNFAADANSTIRFTYGTVDGYSPRDAVWYIPQTTLGGVIEKNTGEFPFKVPQELHDIYHQSDFGNYIDPELGDIPVCFLNTTNVTGGNSGSPTLNARGEQVGIIFDMTYESVIGDYFIIPELQRTISVDIRYILFITDKFAGAQHILNELVIN